MKTANLKKAMLTLSLGLTASAVLATGQTASANDWGAMGAPQPWSWEQAPAWGVPYDLGQTEELIYENNGTTLVSDTTVSSSAIAAAAANTSSSNLYPIGQCTWGVKELAPWASNYWGNGGDWAANAAADGFAVGTTPVVGAIAVWTDGGYGHVALVTEVVSETSIQVLESNVNGNMTIANHRGYFDPTTAQGTVSYIYPA